MIQILGNQSEGAGSIPRKSTKQNVAVYMAVALCSLFYTRFLEIGLFECLPMDRIIFPRENLKFKSKIVYSGVFGISCYVRLTPLNNVEPRYLELKSITLGLVFF